MPDPLELGTWGPSLPLVTEELVELALDEQRPVRVPRHAWLHTQASSEPERGATTVLDAQRALADFELAEFAPHRFYTATPEEIMAVAATVAHTSYIKYSPHPDIETAVKRMAHERESFSPDGANSRTYARIAATVQSAYDRFAEAERALLETLRNTGP